MIVYLSLCENFPLGLATEVYNNTKNLSGQLRTGTSTFVAAFYKFEF